LDTTTPQPVYNIRILSNSNVKALSATASQTLLCEVENFSGESGGFFAVRPRGLYKLGLSPRPELRPIFNSNKFFLNVTPAQNNSNGVIFLQAASGSILGSCGVARCPALYPLYVLPRPRLQLTLLGREYVGPGFKKWARLEVDRCQQVSEDVVRCVADGLRIDRYPDLLLEGSRLQWNEDEGKMFVEVRESFVYFVTVLRIRMFLGLRNPDPLVRGSVPDPGSGFFVTTGSGIRNRFFPDPGSQTLIFESLVTFMGGKVYISYFFENRPEFFSLNYFQFCEICGYKKR
jgi:hypothetical protein